MNPQKQKALETKKLNWLRKATGLGEALPDIYDRERFPDFRPNGVGPSRVGWIFPDWWPFTVAWRFRWKITASADFHDFLYSKYMGGFEADRLAADRIFRACLVVAGKEIKAWPVWLRRIRRNRMALMARIYFAAVRHLGKGSFHYV